MITSLQPNPVTLGTADPQIEIPINKWWRLKSDAGADASWQQSYERLLGRLFFSDTEMGRLLGETEANELYGEDGLVTFTGPTYERDAEYKREQAKKQYEMQEWLNATSKQRGIMRGAVGIGAEISGSMFNSNGPFNIDFGLSTLPIFGTSTKAAIAANAAQRAGKPMASTLGKIYEKGGLVGIPIEKWGVLASRPVLTEVVLNGAASSSIGNLVTFLDQKSRGEDTNYILGVGTELLGAVAIHGGVKALGFTLRRAGALLRNVGQETQEVVMQRAANQAAMGETGINVTDTILADESVIHWRARGNYIEVEAKIAERNRVVSRPVTDNPMATATELLAIAKRSLDELAQNPQANKQAIDAIQTALDRIKQGDRSFDAFRELGLFLDRVYVPEVTEQLNVALRQFVSPESHEAAQVARDAVGILKEELVAVNKQLDDALQNELQAIELVGKAEPGLSKAETKARRQLKDEATKTVAEARAKREAVLKAIDDQLGLADKADANVGVTKKELENHAFRLDQLLRKDVETIREQQAKKLIEMENPAAKAAKETSEAASDVAELEKQVNKPQAEKFKQAAGKPESQAKIDADESALLRSEIEADLKSRLAAAEPQKVSKPSWLSKLPDYLVENQVDFVKSIPIELRDKIEELAALGKVAKEIATDLKKEFDVLGRPSDEILGIIRSVRNLRKIPSTIDLAEFNAWAKSRKIKTSRAFEAEAIAFMDGLNKPSKEALRPSRAAQRQNTIAKQMAEEFETVKAEIEAQKAKASLELKKTNAAINCLLRTGGLDG
jgi:hypothetical protein